MIMPVKPIKKKVTIIIRILSVTKKLSTHIVAPHNVHNLHITVVRL